MTKFFAIDFETLGLDERDHCLIQVAGRVYAPGTPPVELGRTGDILIRPVQGYLVKGSSFAIDMHNRSGILSKAIDEGIHVAVAEERLLAFVDKFVVGDEPVHFLGNSVWFDKFFARQWMPRLFERMHYRILDVTSVSLFMELFTGKSPMDWEKKKAHTSDADLEETWNEVTTYAKRLGLIR